MDPFLTATVGGAEPSVPHVVLVGLPGAGKSTVGRGVAELLGRPFLDFDREIERRTGSSVAEIFAERGEAEFRALELALTRELRAMGNMILAPGGGWATNPEAVGLLRPPARLIYLKVDPETALRRLGDERSVRPLLTRPDPTAEMRRLLGQRRAAYANADHTVDTEVVTMQHVIDLVAELASFPHGS